MNENEDRKLTKEEITETATEAAEETAAEAAEEAAAEAAEETAAEATESNIPRFYDAVYNHRRDTVMSFLKQGILREISEGKTGIYKKLMLLRDKQIMSYMDREEKNWPVEMLDIDYTNALNRDFVSFVLEKYHGKFDISGEENQNRLFEAACLTANRKVIISMLNKKQGAGKYYCLAINNISLLNLIPRIDKSLFTNDLAAELYFKAAFADNSEERINTLWKMCIDITAVNKDGKTAYNLVTDRIKTYQYAKNKNGTMKRKQHEHVAKLIKRLMKTPLPEEDKKKTKIILIVVIAAAVCIIAGVIAFIVAKDSSEETETSEETVTETVSEDLESDDELNEDDITDDDVIEDDISDDDVTEDDISDDAAEDENLTEESSSAEDDSEDISADDSEEAAEADGVEDDANEAASETDAAEDDANETASETDAAEDDANEATSETDAAEDDANETAS